MQPTEAGLELRSLIKSSGELELSLIDVVVPEPRENQVLVQVQAAPINPSDLGLLLGAADPRTASWSGTADRPTITVKIPPALMRSMAGRLDQSMPVGNEGAGLVVRAGDAPGAQSLLGKTVAMIGGAMYTRYRMVDVENCLLLPEGATAAEGASCFVNPLTALGMVDTMRAEGHSALVHTAAASNLGQMLNRICQSDGVDLVNIVRSASQVDLLRQAGARYVCDSTVPDFTGDLINAVKATGATLGFDAIGGGRLASQILSAMETAASAGATNYSRYGSSVHKQVYIYGGLDIGPTELTRGFGMAWGIGGWLLFGFLQKAGPQRVAQLKARVAAELKTTFASHYTRTLSFTEALNPDNIAGYAKRATGEKYLIDPSLAAGSSS